MCIRDRAGEWCGGGRAGVAWGRKAMGVVQGIGRRAGEWRGEGKAGEWRGGGRAGVVWGRKAMAVVQGYWREGRREVWGMLVETSKAFMDPSAMMTQMKEDLDFWSLSHLTILCWRTLLVITKHPKDGHGIAQMDNTTARLITFYRRSDSDQNEHCQNTKFSRSRHRK